jgi:hypothetical protein
MARALSDSGQNEEAVRQVQVCIRLRPQSKEARDMLMYLTLHKTDNAETSASQPEAVTRTETR